ncbi:MAG: glycoside hydrolase family 3 N-terminal domain-containing protein, partial [Vicinamibacterales bacterium]
GGGGGPGIRVSCLVAIAAASLSLAGQAQAPRPLYRDPAQPVEARVRDLLGRMTLEDKFWQLFMIPGDLDDPGNDYSHGIFGLQISTAPAGDGAGGAGVGEADAVGSAAVIARAHAERINAIQRYFVEQTRLGIPIIPFDEAVHGLTRDGATTFPQAIALAATWDPAFVSRVSDAIAAEVRSRGIRQVLSPVVNIADDVRWGRVEETYGEDPYLVSVMARAFVRAFESTGIVATPKHFVANVGEGGRDSYPIDHSLRLLTERYFPPFEAAIAAGARSIMTAYNSVDGLPATQNDRLLNDILKGQWGFRGFVISDAAATGGATVLHMTEPDTPTAAAHALRSGLDVIFQSRYGQQRPYLDAFRRGLIPDTVIDAAVARVLRVKFELGLFEQPYVDPDVAARTNGNEAHLALAREASARSIVLLRNDAGLLPLDPARGTIGVIGVDAEEVRLGGYSGFGTTRVSMLDGVRRLVAREGAVRFAPGPGRRVPDLVVVPEDALASTDESGDPVAGLRGEYFDNITLDGTPRLVRTDRRLDFRWTLNSPGRGIPFDWYSVRWTGTITAPADGVRRIAVEGNDGYRLYLDGRLAIDNWTKRGFGRRAAEVVLRAGVAHDVRLEFFESTGNARVRLLWDAGVVDDSEARIREAVALAAASEVAIVVAGAEEGEFQDRAHLALPGRQPELIERVAATGTPTVVVVIGGSAITMSPWLDRVGAVLDAWYPGEQGGTAVADVLFGRVSPAGRLPITFPVFEGQLPLHYDHKPTGRGDDYVDLTGMPLFPFGHGLSYTTFEYSDLRVAPDDVAPDGQLTVRCRVRNSGPRAGDEVVQLYLRDILASVARPVQQLRGFTRIHLNPGESLDVTFTLGPEDLRLLDANRQWVVEPGAFRVMVGASSEDIRLRGQFTVR